MALTQASEAPPARPRHEIFGIAVVCVALFALASLVAGPVGVGATGLVGPAGAVFASSVVLVFGYAAFSIPFFLGAAGVALFRGSMEQVAPPRLAAAVGLIVGLSALLGLVGSADVEASAGGVAGGFLATVARDHGGSLGAYLAAAVLTVLSLKVLSGTSVHGAIERAGAAVRGAVAAARERREERRRIVTTKPPRNERRPETEHDDGPPIVQEPERGATATRRRNGVRQSLPLGLGDKYRIPSPDLLDEPPHDTGRIDEEALRRSADILEAKLANFGIQGKVVAVRPGPVITTFEIEPAPGVKVNRIVNLQDDLTMALRALGVRIIAPIPGKAVVGIEVANARRETVYLREIIDSPEFVQSKSHITLALGKDSVGHPVATDLAKMPHLLLAGATGTGKSVSLNAMIMSILMKSTPRDVRIVMIDLKMLELSMYEDLPHLLVPVVTDPKKAVIVLNNLVEEMDNRYRTLKEMRVRNIDGYNQLIDESEAEEEVIELTEVIEEGDLDFRFDDGDEEVEDEDEEDDAEADEEDAPHAAINGKRRERMARIVVIIDELADLMMSSNRQAEDPITRLAQKARACGIHLILATQRPSVDVITGLIKANFPARVAFQVASRVDSRTILDSMGAERLLGQGDMLFSPAGPIRRLHGAYVSEDEIRRVTAVAKRQGRPDYNLELLEGKEEEAVDPLDEDLDDEMYDLAVRLVTETRQASISWVQRRLRVGYNRAARLVERMEREQVVGPSDHGRPREVLVPAPPKD